MTPAVEQEMRRILNQVFQGIRLNNGRWAQFEDVWDTIDQMAALVVANFKKEVNRQTSNSSVIWLLMEVVHRHTTPQHQDGLLVEVLHQGERDAIANDFVEWWRSLPRTYEVHFPVPRIVMAALPLQMAPDVEFRLMSWDRRNVLEHSQYFGGMFGNALMDPGVAELQMPTLCVRVGGFALGVSAKDSAIKRAVFTATTCLQLGCAVGLFERRRAYTIPLCKDFTFQDGGSATPDVRHEMQVPEPFRQTLRDLVTPADVMPREGSERLVERLIAPIAKVVSRIHHAGLPKPLDTDQNIKHANQVAIAANWYHDAALGDRDANRVIRTAVAIETLYGGKDEDPVIATLANRLAFALAKNPHDRERISKGFKTFYKMRSAVVHNGHLQLDDEQLEQLLWAEALVMRALRSEAALLP